jgi:hypothetical protein
VNDQVDPQAGGGADPPGPQGGEAPVQQHDHAGAQRAGQALPVDGLAAAARAEHGVDDGTGAAPIRSSLPMKSWG